MQTIPLTANRHLAVFLIGGGEERESNNLNATRTSVAREAPLSETLIFAIGENANDSPFTLTSLL